MGNSISSPTYDNLIIDPRITVHDAILSTANNQPTHTSVGNRLAASPESVGNRLDARSDMLRRSSTQREQERIILVQEGNRLVERRFTEIHPEQQTNNASVSGNHLDARSDILRRSSSEREQERIILVQEENRLVVRRFTEIHQEQQTNNASVSPSINRDHRQILVQEGNRLIVRRTSGIPQLRLEQLATDATPNPRQVDDSSSLNDSSIEKLSLVYQLQPLSDFEQDILIAEGQSCSICIEDFSSPSSTVLRLPCGHIYHGTCICEWISNSRRSCPTCRQRLRNF